jgi:hypothetical protein
MPLALKRTLESVSAEGCRGRGRPPGVRTTIQKCTAELEEVCARTSDLRDFAKREQRSKDAVVEDTIPLLRLLAGGTDAGLCALADAIAAEARGAAVARDDARDRGVEVVERLATGFGACGDDNLERRYVLQFVAGIYSIAELTVFGFAGLGKNRDFLKSTREMVHTHGVQSREAVEEQHRSKAGKPIQVAQEDLDSYWERHMADSRDRPGKLVLDMPPAGVIREIMDSGLCGRECVGLRGSAWECVGLGGSVRGCVGRCWNVWGRVGVCGTVWVGLGLVGLVGLVGWVGFVAMGWL